MSQKHLCKEGERGKRQRKRERERERKRGKKQRKREREREVREVDQRTRHKRIRSSLFVLVIGPGADVIVLGTEHHELDLTQGVVVHKGML